MQTAKKKLKFRETFKSLYYQGGVSRFWKGSLLIGTASVPAHALYFSVYERIKDVSGVNQAVRKNNKEKSLHNYKISIFTIYIY